MTDESVRREARPGTKVYLGDAVYAEMDDFGAIVLTTEDGIRVTNRIVLEREVWEALDLWRAALAREAVPWVVYECECGNRDLAPAGGHPECSAGCGRRMTRAGVPATEIAASFGSSFHAAGFVRRIVERGGRVVRRERWSVVVEVPESEVEAVREIVADYNGVEVES